MIEEQVTRFVADVEITDDCLVELTVRARRMALTAPQARELAADLVRVAKEAERASESLLRPFEPSGFDTTVVHPECIAGKCGNCDGFVPTLSDEWMLCGHDCHDGGAA